MASIKADAKEARSAGKRHTCTVCAYGTNSKANDRPMYIDVLLNGVAIKAMVDTGALLTVMDSRSAEANGWDIQRANAELSNASGTSMDCCGKTMAKIEARIGRQSKITTHELLVVKPLCAPMLFGLDLIKALQIVVNPSVGKQLDFQKTSKVKGLIAAEETTIPARSGKCYGRPSFGEPGNTIRSSLWFRPICSSRKYSRQHK